MSTWISLSQVSATYDHLLLFPSHFLYPLPSSPFRSLSLKWTLESKVLRSLVKLTWLCAYSLLIYLASLLFFTINSRANKLLKVMFPCMQLICFLSFCVHPHGIKLKGYHPYFGVQPFTFPSKYFATLQKGRGNFL